MIRHPYKIPRAKENLLLAGDVEFPGRKPSTGHLQSSTSLCIAAVRPERRKLLLSAQPGEASGNAASQSNVHTGSGQTCAASAASYEHSPEQANAPDFAPRSRVRAVHVLIGHHSSQLCNGSSRPRAAIGRWVPLLRCRPPELPFAVHSERGKSYRLRTYQSTSPKKPAYLAVANMVFPI